MDIPKRVKNKKQHAKLFIPHEQLNFLDDKEIILVSTSFLYYIRAYHQLFNKKNPEGDKIIKNLFTYSNNNPKSIYDPTYLPINVKDAKTIIREIQDSSVRKTAFKKVLNFEKEKLTSHDAYNLLIKDVINVKNDFFKEENKWILHSLYVGMAARRIANKLNLNPDYAAALGYIHDIGRKFNHDSHVILGYRYLESLGFSKEARICLTHSFIKNDINLTAGSGPKNLETYEFLDNYLKKNPVNGYDKVIQLCDLIASEKGFTTLENRLLDITERKGVFDNSNEHFDESLKLKKEIEKAMKLNLYDLFIEIPVDDLNNIKDVEKQLKKMFKENSKEKIKL